jgi:hypothetical protein
MRHRLALAAVLAPFLACQPPPEPMTAAQIDAAAVQAMTPAVVTPAAPEPESLILHVFAVTVTKTRPGGFPWDLPPPSNGADCGILGLLDGALPGLGRLAGALCTADKAKFQPYMLPDLAVRIDAGGQLEYQTPISPDTTHAAFMFDAPIAVAAVRAEGVVLEVLDDDGDAGRDVIATVRISAAQLLQAAKKPPGRMFFTQRETGLEALLLEVHVPPPVWK